MAAKEGFVNLVSQLISLGARVDSATKVSVQSVPYTRGTRVSDSGYTKVGVQYVPYTRGTRVSDDGYTKVSVQSVPYIRGMRVSDDGYWCSDGQCAICMPRIGCHVAILLRQSRGQSDGIGGGGRE